MNFPAPLLATWRAILALLAGALTLHGQEPVRTVEALRALPPAEVAAGRAVELSGVVTYLRDTRQDFNFILDDGGGGVMVYPTERALLQLGQRVAISGTTRLDRPFLRIRATALSPGAAGPLPTPLAVTLGELLAGRCEGRYVQVEEVVRVVRLEDVELRPRRLALDLGARGNRLTAWISHYEGAEARFAPGMRVRVAGVCLRWRNDRAQPVSTSLVINSPAEVTELSAAPAPEPETLGDLLLWTDFDQPAALHETSGVVTYCEPGELVVIQNGTRALRVRPAPTDALPIDATSAPMAFGAQVAVTGFFALGEYTSELEDARIRALGSAPAPPPSMYRSAEALLASGEADRLVDRDARLVMLMAMVREVRNRDGRCAVELVSAGHPFTTWLSADAVLPPGLRSGAEVRVQGICALHLSPTRRRLGQHPSDFSLLLRGASDLTVLRAGPWWTPRRLAVALGAVIALAALSGGWAAWAGRKNAQLLAEIAGRRRAEQQLAGERRRMAADLHNTLEQTLLAARLQLQAAGRTIDRQPESASAQIHLAHQLLARSQQEVRDAVWDLHAGDGEALPLGTLLTRACAEAAAGATAAVQFSVEGEPRPAPPFLVAQSIRLVREAVANALKHGQPSRVTVTLAFADHTLRVRIADDGRGFDPAQAAGPETGHFGLNGLGERLQRFGGALEIRSAPGSGAELVATLPLP